MRFLLLSIALGCSSGSDAASPPENDAGSEASSDSACAEITVNAFLMGPKSAAGGSVTATPSPAMGGPNADTFRVELMTGAANGEIDLANESDYATCKHCVSVWIDSQDAKTATVFFAKSGSLTLREVSTPPTSEFGGTLRDVRLVEVKIDPKTFATTEVEGGKCLILKVATFSTVLPKGGTCTTAADCIDTTVDICDPKTAMCAAGQCGPTSGKDCPSTDICVYQARGTGVGACYPICKPFGDSCGTGAECLISRFDGTTGYCKKRGTGGPDSACTRSDLDTSCVAGYVCDSLDKKCRKQCDFFGSGRCDGAQRCVPPGICTDGARDPAKIGEACRTTAKAGDACGETATTLSGVCAGTPTLKCAKWCRMEGADCPTGQSCQATGVASIGTCG
jgi:hypothetical protein